MTTDLPPQQPDLRPRTTGEVLDDAWRLALADAPVLLALAGLFAVPAFAALLLLLTRPTPEGVLARCALPALTALLLPLTGLGSGACQELLRRRAEGTPVTLGGCLRAASRHGPGHVVARGLALLFLLPGLGALGLALELSRGEGGGVFLVLFGGVGLFLIGVALCLTHALHPLLAAGELPPFTAMKAALSRELRRNSTRAAAAAVSRVCLYVFAVLNLHLLVGLALWVAGGLGGLETAFLEVTLSLANPVYALAVGGLAWLLLTPFAEAVNHGLHLDGRVRHDALDLARRVRALFPVPDREKVAALLLTLGGLWAATPAAVAREDRHAAVRGVRAELRVVLGEVKAADPYPGGAAYARRLEALAERLDGPGAEGERTRWFRAALDGFAGRSREGAVEVLEDLDRKLALVEESLEPPGEGEKRRSRAEVRSLVPGAGDDKAKAEPAAKKKDEEPKRREVRRDDPGEDAPGRGGGPGVVSAGAGGAGFGGLGWMLLAGLLLAVVAVAVVLWRQRGPSESVEQAPAAEAPLPARAPAFEPERHSAAELRRRAEALARRGEFLEALRVLYLSALTLLHEIDLIRYEPTRTNGEYLRQLRAAEGAERVAESFGGLTRLFERQWYGERAAGADDYASGLSLAARLGEEVRRW